MARDAAPQLSFTRFVQSELAGGTELLSAERKGDSAMAKTYREIAIEQMLQTVEEAMSQVIDWWADLPPPMKEAIGQFRTQLGAAIDSVEFVKRALDREVHETDRGKGPP
jgi:hypothetical protein